MRGPQQGQLPEGVAGWAQGGAPRPHIPLCALGWGSGILPSALPWGGAAEEQRVRRGWEAAAHAWLHLHHL